MVCLFSSYHSVIVLLLQFAVTLILYCSDSCFFSSFFAESQKAAISFTRSVCLSVLNNKAPTGWNFMKFDILFLKCFHYEKNSGYFTCKPANIFDHISPNRLDIRNVFQAKFADKI